MTYKVIECIEISQSTQTLKIADFAIKPKKQSLHRDLLYFFNLYGVY